MESEADSPDLAFLDYGRILLRRRWVIVLATLVGVAAGVGISLSETKIYEASAQIAVQPDTSQSSLSNNVTSSDPQIAILTELQVVQSPDVADLVRQRFGQLGSMQARVMGNADVIQISVQDKDPHMAARLATGYAGAYTAYRQQRDLSLLRQARQQIQDQLDSVQRSIGGLGAGSAPVISSSGSTANSETVQRADLQQEEQALNDKLTQIKVTIGLTTASTGVQLVSAATVPTSPVAPRRLREALIGLLAGLILGIGAAFAWDRIDQSIKTSDDLRRAAPGVPVFGILPFVRAMRDTLTSTLISIDDPDSSAGEAYRALRTSVRFAVNNNQMDVVLITSPGISEGKSTMVGNLGVAMARTDLRVVMVDCDLRRPRLHELFGLENAVGVTSVLLGDASLAEAVQPALPNQDHLWLIPSGPPPPDPSELLASAPSGEILRSLAAEFDLVLVDSPPVVPVTDAAVIASHVDATLLVVLTGHTTRRAVLRTIEVLQGVGTSVTGVVLNGVKGEPLYDYGYGRYYRRVPASTP